MTDSLPQLEAQRTDLFRQLAAVGDFRRGSITATSGKCGKPGCHCAKREDVGHGPNFRLTRRGKRQDGDRDISHGRRAAQGGA